MRYPFQGRIPVIGDLILNGGKGGFTANEFSVDLTGKTVLFTHTPISG